jgi:proline iminopeptidase
MRVRANGIGLFFDVEGASLVPDGYRMRTRPTMVALHGGPGFDHTYFKPILSEISDVAQIVYLDQRGHGRSDRGTPDQWTMDAWAQDVRAFCNAVGIEHPIVLGNSFGSLVALAYAVRYPDHPAGLILDSGAPVLDIDHIVGAFQRRGGPDVADAAREFLEAPKPESMQRALARCLPFYNVRPMGPEMAEVASRTIPNPQVQLHFWANVRPTFDLRGVLDRIVCPTLILAGALDPVCPIEDQVLMAERIAGAQLEVFDHAGHSLIREQPREALARIRSFVADVSETRWAAGRPTAPAA